MTKKLFAIAIFCILINGVYGQCYKSYYDILQEKLCLENGKFFFELVDPLDPNIKIEGDYITRGDTLIFNPGVSQNEMQVLACESSNYNEEGKFLRLIDQNKSPLVSVTIVSNDNYYSTDREGVVKLKERFPDKVSISISMLSDKVWPNPYQKQYFNLDLDYKTKKKDNFLTILLNIPDEFKMSFECETKLLSRNDSLFYIRVNGQVMDLCFKRDTLITKEPESDSTDFKGAEERLRELQELYKPKEISDFSEYFNPSLIDTFFSYLINKKVELIYNMTDEQVKEYQSKEDFEKYFNLFDKYYGKIIKYEQSTYGIRGNPMGQGKLATATYDIEFEKYKGTASTVFKVVNKDTILMYSFNLSLADYTLIDGFDKISEPAIKAILDKDSKALYKLISQRFKEYNSIADFEAFTNKIFDLDIKDYKIFRNQIGIKEGNEITVMIYEINEGTGYLQLSFTEIENVRYLEGFNYQPKQ